MEVDYSQIQNTLQQWRKVIGNFNNDSEQQLKISRGSKGPEVCLQ